MDKSLSMRQFSFDWAAALAQERFGQSAIDGDQMAGGAARLGSGQEQDGLGAISRVDGLVGEGALGVEASQ